MDPYWSSNLFYPHFQKDESGKEPSGFGTKQAPEPKVYILYLLIFAQGISERHLEGAGTERHRRPFFAGKLILLLKFKYKVGYLKKKRK